MSSNTETTFGARLAKAQSLFFYLNGFANYAPPRPEESLGNFKILLDNIAAMNDEETQKEETHKKSVQKRQQLFRNGDESILKLLSPIRIAVEAQYGKNSPQVQTVGQRIAIIRSTKASAEAEEGNENGQNQTVEGTFSTSQMSYGSLHQHFADLVQTLKSFGNFNPSKAEIKIVALENMLQDSEELLKDITLQYQTLRTKRKQRLDLYDDLTDRIERIKNYIRAAYGKESSEYKLIEDLGI